MVSAAEADPLQARRRQDRRYTGVAIFLHWTMAGLILVNLPLGLAAHFLAEGANDQMITDLHKPIGLSVLALAMVRLAWRVFHKAPILPPTVTRLGRKLAFAVHGLLYGFMIALPLTGWLMTSYFGKHPPSFGLFVIPMLPVTPSMPNAIVVHGWHKWAAIVMVVLVVGHVGAALWHQFVRGDALLGRMWPFDANRIE